MKKNILTSILALVIGLFIFNACQTAKKGSENKVWNIEAKNAELQINLRSPINSANAEELNKEIYQNGQYFLVQDKSNQFKDNAPFVQYLDGGKRERLWFSSSRADENYANKIHTNFYQQIYYCDREIGEGKFPHEGWSAPQKFDVKTDNPMLSQFIETFNLATKGAVTIAGNTMIFSCDQLSENIDNEYKQLWSVDVKNGNFENPKPLTKISSEKTWESQPSLSSNGKHLFFVSNRKVNSNDFSWNNETVGTDVNIYYSFMNNGDWSSPVLVKELYSSNNEITPHLNLKGSKLYYSSNQNRDYEIYEVAVILDNVNGGYSIDISTSKLFDSPLIDNSSKGLETFNLNGAFNQKYPYYYYNPLNKKSPQAFFWASDNPKGMGSFDIYACSMPFNIDLDVILVDKCFQGGNGSIEFPVINISGSLKQTVESDHAHFPIYSGLKYQLTGGSTASPEKGTYYCDKDERYIFNGYSRIVNEVNPEDKKFHNKLINGAEVNSILTDTYGYLPVFDVLNDTTICDTIFITKAWIPKPPCPEVLDIPQKYKSIAYFQTGFWEVNTSENLKRDLEKLHEGYDIHPNNDIYNPQGHIISKRSGYKAYDWETPISAINTKDNHTYSIADARWIELHPFNYYWGDRIGFGAALDERIKGRKDRIAQYVDYAQKVDENLKMLTDTIKDEYISFLDLHKKAKPKLLIEIFAVSDQREVLRGWYIGDTVQYRGSAYVDGEFTVEKVKIIPPKVDESTKTLTEIKPCTIELNGDGNNGSNLGINKNNKTDLNTNLSRLRAWFGYKEIYKHLADSDEFKKYLNNGKVALPDNDISYNDADIIILTQGRRIDYINPKHPYPSANNPNGQGFYEFDQIRRVEVRIRLLFEKQDVVIKDFCCYGKK
jgi:hypothetical protein